MLSRQPGPDGYAWQLKKNFKFEVKSNSERNPNRLLYGLLCVSFVIHLILFMYISGLYSSSSLTYIELTLQNISKAPTRSIPRPRHRPKPPDQPKEIKYPRVTQLVPRLKPISIEPVEKDLPDSLVEGISMPDIPDVSSPDISEWSLDQLAASGDYTTADSYLDMVRLRIERHKRYPENARIRQIEGSVTVRFVIISGGDIRSAEVVKTSGNKALDRAALTAVKNAALFPKAPTSLFKGDIPLELTIVFKLM
jgi:protein TonB